MVGLLVVGETVVPLVVALVVAGTVVGLLVGSWVVGSFRVLQL